MPEQRNNRAANCGARSKKNEKEKSEYRRRQDQGQRRDRLEKCKPPAMAQDQKGCQRHREHK